MGDRIAVAYCVHDDHWFLKESIESFRKAGPVFVFLSRKAWNGTEGDWKGIRAVAEACDINLVEGEWLSEADHRAAALGHLKRNGFTWCLIPDGDEIIEPQLLRQLIRIAEADLADRVFVHWDTYWKSVEYVIRPREGFTPLILLNIRKVHHLSGRLFGGGRPLLLSPEHGLIQHLSYAGPDERIRRKIETWGHRDEVVPGWWERVWKTWDRDRLQRNLHPTHPSAYGFAERIEVPTILRGLAPHRELPKQCGSTVAPSVIIPVHGQFDLVQRCIESLQESDLKIQELILVDDGSPTPLQKPICDQFPIAIFRQDAPRGFASACNAGAKIATGEVLIFLNSDTVLPANSMSGLLASLAASGNIAAVGPYSNAAGHFQQIDPTYTDLSRLNLFAEDFAARDACDVEVDMLVGLCIAVKSSVFSEVGGFDERFGRGTFEDNDLCYRLRRAGYRLILSSRSYVHHEGSRSFAAAGVSMNDLLLRNSLLFQEKWKADLESEFASHLSGMGPDRIIFNEDLRPENRITRLHDQTRAVRISLCMIMRDEERVIEACLASAKPYFDEIILVDTGSNDRTNELADRYADKIVDFPWTDSFSDARNESIRHATGDWIFWMDADDTLPIESGEAIRWAAASADPSIHAFIVPVQFVDDGPGAGTRVDHVKLLRNLPGLKFEGRIHEQILGSLREHGGEVARLQAIVLHSGYDTSPEGQAKKRARDERLLKLDLEERPNHPFVLFNLGMTAHYTGDHETAIDWLDKSLAESKEGESHVRKAIAMKAVSLKALGRKDECFQVLEEGIRQIGDDPELRFQQGLVLSELGRLEEAKSAYLAMDTNIAGHFSSLDIGILSFKRLHNLGSVCYGMGDYSEAKKYWGEVVREATHFLPSAFALFDAALENEDRSTAQEMLEATRRIEGPSENWSIMSFKYGSTFGGIENGIQLLSRAAVHFPNAVPPKLVLMRRLLDEDRVNDALPLMCELEETGVAEAAYGLGIFEIRRGRFTEALHWMSRAHDLNPEHEETKSQIDGLQKLLASGPT